MIAIVAATAALIVAIFLRLDPRLPIGLGLLTLALSGLFIAVELRDVANLMATITFFTLVFGALLALVDLARKPSRGLSGTTSRVESDPLVEGDEN